MQFFRVHSQRTAHQPFALRLLQQDVLQRFALLPGEFREHVSGIALV